MKNLQDNIIKKCKLAKSGAQLLSKNTNKERNEAINLISYHLKKNIKKVLIENKKDCLLAKKNKLPEHLLDRLALDEDRLKNIIKDINNIKKMKDPLGIYLENIKRPNGLLIKKISVPLGVVAVVFESRPNVAVDVACLCIKSGNAAILKGGKEAKYSTEILIKIIRRALSESKVTKNAVISLSNYSRDSVNYLFEMDQYVDVLVPRGGKSLVKSVKENSKIPVFYHLDGICHTFIDEFAKKKMAIDVAFNAKMRRTSICGATETILCHKNIAKLILPDLISKLLNARCEIRGDVFTHHIDKRVKKVNKEDWKTEYLDAIVSIKIVNNFEEAIKHIKKFSSKHTDAIITSKKINAIKFFKEVDSAIVMHNTSTQFADGAEFGLGAEIGIATGKLHARGPVGAKELTTYKYIVEGKGQLRK